MTHNNEVSQRERMFLHDLCNVMAITQGILHLLVAKMKKDPTDLNAGDITEKLEKGLSSLNRMLDLVNKRRTEITEQIKSS